MIWPGFPKRLLSALKGLCCLAQSGGAMHSQDVAAKIGISQAEAAKVLQLLTWGGFVTSRRGYKGGFQLAKNADRITTGEIMDFFFSKYQPEPDGDCPVMCALRDSSAPGQEAFGSLTLADVAAWRTQPGTERPSREAGAR